jgi:hypothetical protein
MYCPDAMQICRDIVERIEKTFEETIEKWIEQVNEICEDLPWPLDVFCHAVTTLIKVIEVVVKTVITTTAKTVCYPVTLAVTLVAEAIQLVLAIPILGPLIRWIVGALVWAWSQWLGLVDAFGGLVGIRPIKHLRLHVIILMRSDHTLTVPVNRIGLAVARAEAIFRARADVKIHTTVHQVDTPSSDDALQVETDAGLFGEDMTGAGLYFQTTITEMLWEDNASFVLRVGAPVVAFIVDGVGPPGRKFGCSAGPLSDYVCIEGAHMIVPTQTTPVVAPIPVETPNATYAMASATLAHEIGHACGLLHAGDDPTNLMYPTGTGPDGSSRGDNLSPFQRAIVRSSPHVTYA